MIKLKGLLEYSLGGFLTLRGYTKIGDLAKISLPDKDFQRELIPQHREDLIEFLSKGEFLFFPEIILGIELSNQEQIDKYKQNINNFFEKIKLSEGFNQLKFQHFKVSYSKTGLLTIYINEEQKVFSRIDGNHRLAAVEEAVKKEPSIGELLTPFSIIIFRTDKEKNRFSKVLFNNINSKAIPVELEHNIKLILDDTENYLDDKLKNDPSFGWSYYLARKIYNSIDFDLIPNLRNSFKDDKGRLKTASGFLSIIEFLLKNKKIDEADSSIEKIKEALSEVNGIYNDTPLKNSKSLGLLTAFLYYKLHRKPSLLNSFKKWILDNQLTSLKNISSDSSVKVFNGILASKNRTIFVSMPFRDKTENHYKTIKRIVDEINKEFKLKTKLKVVRVDWFEDGTSYEITSKIFDLIDESGFLIADLTDANPNVYHEVGYLMGRNKAKGKLSYSNFLLIIKKENDKEPDVAFNLKGLKQIRFTNNEELGEKIKENLLKFYNLKNES